MSPKTRPSDPITVIVVEDDVLFRDSIRELIDDSPAIRCGATFESCEDALVALQDELAPDVILLDVDLPGMSGIEGISHFRRVSPASRIIILTVFDDDDKIFNAVCQGASGYLQKSASAENVGACILDVVAGGAAMSPHIAAKVLSMFAQYSEPKKEYGLTIREKEILHHLVGGVSKKHIAETLFISQHTVETHLKNIYAKLQVHSQIDVVAKALREHLI